MLSPIKHMSAVDYNVLKMRKLWQLVSTLLCNLLHGLDEGGVVGGRGAGGGCTDWCWFEVSTGPNLEGFDRSQSSQPGSRTLAGPDNEVVKPAMRHPHGWRTRTSDTTYSENHSCQDNVPCLVRVDAHSCGPWLDSLALEVNTTPYPVSLLLLGQFFPRPNYSKISKILKSTRLWWAHVLKTLVFCQQGITLLHRHKQCSQCGANIMSTKNTNMWTCKISGAGKLIRRNKQMTCSFLTHSEMGVLNI